MIKGLELLEEQKWRFRLPTDSYLQEAKGQQCYRVPPPLPPPLLPLLLGELLSEAPTRKKAFPVSPFQSPTIASHQQNLTGRESGNTAFRFPNPSVERMVRQAIRRQWT